MGQHKTKLGLIGAGTIGKRHLQAISEVTQAELVAIVDTDPLAQSIAIKINASFFSSTSQMPYFGRPKLLRNRIPRPFTQN